MRALKGCRGLGLGARLPRSPGPQALTTPLFTLIASSLMRFLNPLP